MYSYILDILFFIVLSFIFGEQFLYWNSVSPYCFPLPTVLLYIYILIICIYIFPLLCIGKKYH